MSIQYCHNCGKNFDAEKKVEALLTPDVEESTVRENRTPEDLEGLKKEFEKKFNRNGRTYIENEWEVSKQVYEQIWNFFAPHLNSRNLLERFVEYCYSHIGGCDDYGNFPSCDWNVLNKFLDEFLESESKHE